MEHFALPSLIGADSAAVEHTREGGMDAPVRLDECQSPLAQWLGVPAPCTADRPACFMMEKELHGQDKFPFAVPAVPETAAPAYAMVPVIMGPQWPYVAVAPTVCWENGTGDMQCGEYEQYDQLSDSALSSSGRGDAEAETLTGRGKLTASAARRRRRQRAAASRECGARTVESETASEPLRAGGANTTDELLSQLNADGDEKATALAQLRGSVRRLTFDAAGCRVIQLALKVADSQTVAEFVAELHGCVLRAIQSPHGNFVIQKLVEELPAACSVFVAAEILEKSADVVRHRYGCRVMCRLLEHSGSEKETLTMMENVLQEAEDLCHHPFGHHVIESALEHGREEHKHRIAVALHANVFRNACDRHGSFVIEKALQNCSSADQNMLASAIVNDPEKVVALAEHQFGVHVVRALLAHRPEIRRVAHHILQQAAERLQANANGARIIESMRALTLFPR